MPVSRHWTTETLSLCLSPAETLSLCRRRARCAEPTSHVIQSSHKDNQKRRRMIGASSQPCSPTSRSVTVRVARAHLRSRTCVNAGPLRRARKCEAWSTSCGVCRGCDAGLRLRSLYIVCAIGNCPVKCLIEGLANWSWIGVDKQTRRCGGCN
jgi:hypothetical protein